MTHDLRALLRWLEGCADDPTAVVLGGRTMQSPPESGARAGYDGPKKRKGSKIRLAVDPLGHLLALQVTPANAPERDPVAVAFVDRGYTGAQPAAAAAAHGIQVEVVKLPGAKHGFVLLPRRWEVERSFAWASRFRRLTRDYERLTETVKGLHFLAVAFLMLRQLFTAEAPGP